MVSSAEITLRRPGRGSYRTRVMDISPFGCRAEFVDRPKTGEMVWVKLDDLRALEAEVCWVEGIAVGLRFRQPIHSTVFDMLSRKLAGGG